MDIVSDAAEESMGSAIEEVKSLPHYSENGEVMKLYSITITKNPSSTDARHDSTANAYHTTVPCLSGRCSAA